MTLSDVIAVMREALFSEAQIDVVISGLKNRPLSANAVRVARFRSKHPITVMPITVMPPITVTPETPGIARTITVMPSRARVEDNLLPLVLAGKKESKSIGSFASSSSEGSDDPATHLFGEKEKTKKCIRGENDERFLDHITDLWNPWAAQQGPRRARQVKALTPKRAVRCRIAIAELMKLSHAATADDAFGQLLAQCNRSFFVCGDPRSPLTFDQLIDDDFMGRMYYGEFVFEGKSNGKGHF